jgi:hypothetical protein
MGNTVVQKPSEYTTLCDLALVAVAVPQVINGSPPATAGGQSLRATVSRFRSDQTKVFPPERRPTSLT